MIKLALCDDDDAQRSDLHKLLLEYAAARPELALRPSLFSSGEQLLAAVEDDGPFALYLLDVVMPGLSGIGLGLRLREMDRSGTIIYLSVSPEYAVDSYAARAFYYLMKPPEKGRLFQVLDQAVEEMGKQRSACVAVKTHAGLRRVRLDELMYAELAGRSIHYHLAGGELLESTTVRSSFQEAAAPLLTDSRFFLCGASFVVNLFYVTAVEKGCFLMDGGARVALPRHYFAQARQRWQDFWLSPR